MDRKRINDALDKHLRSERSSPSTSRAATKLSTKAGICAPLLSGHACSSGLSLRI